IAPPPPISPWTAKRRLAVGVAGGGVAAIVVGGVLATQAQSYERDAFARCPMPGEPCGNAGVAQSLLDRAHRRALAANLGFGAGPAVVVAAGVLWYLGAPREVAVAASPTGATASVSFGF